MKYIVWSDLTTKIKQNILFDLLEISSIDSTNKKLINLEQESLDIVAGYLSSFYNLDHEWSQTGDNRNQMVIGMVTDIMIYLLLTRTTSDMLPESRIVRYNDTIKLLKDCSQRKMKLNLPEKNIDYQKKDQILFSSDEKTHYDY